MSRPVVAHYNYELVDRTETFIYNYVSNLRTFHSIYFADNLMNLDAFPLPERDVYRVPCAPPKKYTRQWLYEQYRRRIDGDLSSEEAVLRARRARLIHAHFGPQGFFALTLRGRLRIPIITTFYGYDVSQLLAEPEWKSRYATLFAEGDLFLVEGEFMKARLIALGCPASKIAIQRIAVPLDRIPFVARRPKQGGEKPVVLFSGRFIEKKGAVDALGAIARVKSDGAHVEFRMAGDGPLRPQIEAAVRDQGLSADVRMLGFLGYEEYLREMGRADIFLHPSVTAADGDSEGGAPTTILEAQATGMPVVATSHADIPNVVVPGKSALLAAERDVAGLAEHLRYLLKHQDRWEEMGRAGRRFVEQHHDLDKEIDRLEDKYRSVLA
jgi:colanic acid/amylovoran biosynthesis glycosyltransferase